jgi:hypothetical protein
VIENPWHSLLPSFKTDLLNARRVDASLPFAFFWAKDAEGRCLLLLRYAAPLSVQVRLPRLKGIDVTTSNADADGSSSLMLRLLDQGQRDLFYRLCMDIVASTRTAKNESAAVAATLSRTWRWHHLLQGGSDARLSPEEQKGLLGELLVLQYLLRKYSPGDAVQMWRGPLGAPKDFQVGRISVEAKARRGAATPYVSISSEHQLDTAGVDLLLLFVHELDEAPADDPRGVTLSEVAKALHSSISDVDAAAVSTFEALLMSAGFRWDDDYSDARWLRGREIVYRVDEGFPRITPDLYPAGVSRVAYSISLPDCEPFLLTSEAVDSFLTRGGNAH